MSSHDTIFHMNADCIYNPKSIERKLNFMKRTSAECVFCDSTLCYDIYNKELTIKEIEELELELDIDDDEEKLTAQSFNLDVDGDGSVTALGDEIVVAVVDGGVDSLDSDGHGADVGCALELHSHCVTRVDEGDKL